MKNLLLFGCIFIAINACTTVQPALSVSNSPTLESLPVKGRQGLLINQKLSFGEYQTSRVKRSWTRGGNSRINVPVGNSGASEYPDLLSLNYIDRNQSFHFQMNDVQGNNSDVYATSEFSSEDLQFEERKNVLEKILGFNLKSSNLFYLQLFVNENAQPWQLVLDNEAAQVFPGRYKGIFALNEKQYYTLEPITKVQGKKGPEELLAGSIGFEIFNIQNQSVAAVSLVDGGHIYLNTPNPEERFLMANLGAALLLQENIADQ